VSKNNPLDQFFIPDEVADYCVQFFKEATGKTDIKILEPCAGGKAFIRAFENQGYSDYEMLDLDPQTSDIQQQDFLEYGKNLEGMAVITNPPFGFRSKLSVAFFNKAAELGAKYISMLTLANHGGVTVLKKLNRGYLLLDEVYIISDFLTVSGDSAKMANTRLVFQVWKKSETLRQPIIIKKYVRNSDDFNTADFWMKCTTINSPIFTQLEDFINDESNYTCKKKGTRTDIGEYEKIINGQTRRLSENLLGFNKLPEVSIDDIREAIKVRYWRLWNGAYIYEPSFNQFLDEYYSGKTFKTKQF
jgi:predicted RNA methylase